MKLLSSYIKELKIAARGFYFYIEIGMAVILLVILLVAVSENPSTKTKEFLFYDMPQNVVENMFEKDIKNGTVKVIEPIEFDVKAVDFTVTNEETQITTSYSFDKGKIEVKAFEIYDSKIGNVLKTVYIASSKEDLIRLAYSEKEIGSIIKMNANGEISYTYYNQGYETDRMISLLYILHNESLDNLQELMDNQVVRKLGEVEVLNNRENMIPPVIVFTGSLMGFFIILAYIFLDKTEGVIRAFAVTPSSVWKYLLSKTMIIMTTTVISSSIVVIPIMGNQPNYLLFYIFLLVTTFAFASLGLLISSFYNSISKAFGALYAIMIALMLPAFSYYIPSFDPVWLRFFPSYSMLQGFKEIIMVNGDTSYVLIYSALFLVGGIVIFYLANLKFKKTLTI